MKILISFILLSTSACAFADALTYANQPIPPSCFQKMFNLDKTTDAVSVNSCSKIAAKVELQDGYYSSHIGNDLVRYTVLGNSGNKFLVLAEINSGGSGFFTNVAWIENSGDKLKLLKNLASGDRCNGGATKAGAWRYSINLTPVDLVQLGSGTPLKLDAYRDLDASAASCVGKAFYQFDPKTETAKFSELKLKSEQLTMEKWVLDINYQYCFNRLYNSYLNRGQIVLKQVDLDRFKNEFEGICMASGR